MILDKNIKGIIFDLDGTLIDSMGVWEHIDEVFLKERDIEIPKDYLKQIEGRSMKETAIFFKERFKTNESIEDLMDIWNQMAFEDYRYNVKVKNGVMVFLQEAKRRNISMAVATSNSPELVDACFTQHNFHEFINAIISSKDVENGKPSPDIYLLAADRISINPKDCIVFEDIIPGIKGAKSAGMKSVAVKDKYSMEDDEDKRRLADYYINDFTEVGFDY